MGTFLTHHLPVLDALSTYGQGMKSHEHMMTAVHQDLTQGMSLGESLESQAFLDPLMISSILIAEEGGTLGQCFLNLHHYGERQDNIRKKIRKALYYPSFLGIFIVTVLVLFLPPFLDSMDGFLAQLHPGQKMMSNSPHLIQGVRIVGYFILLLILILIGLKYSKTRYYYDAFWMECPFIGPLNRLTQTVFFFQTLSFNLTAGVHVMTALKLQAHHTVNHYVQASLHKMIGFMDKGTPFSEAFALCLKGNGLVMALLTLGESTGTLGDSFSKIAEILEKILDRQMTLLMETIQPLCLLLIGLFLCWIIFSLFYPLYDILGAIIL